MNDYQRGLEEEIVACSEKIKNTQSIPDNSFSKRSSMALEEDWYG